MTLPNHLFVYRYSREKIDVDILTGAEKVNAYVSTKIMAKLQSEIKADKNHVTWPGRVLKNLLKRVNETNV